jgi:hypothetical protein
MPSTLETVARGRACTREEVCGAVGGGMRPGEAGDEGMEHVEINGPSNPQWLKKA